MGDGVQLPRPWCDGYVSYQLSIYRVDLFEFNGHGISVRSRVTFSKVMRLAEAGAREQSYRG
jgi:hypothetical protein